MNLIPTENNEQSTVDDSRLASGSAVVQLLLRQLSQTSSQLPETDGGQMKSNGEASDGEWEAIGSDGKR